MLYRPGSVKLKSSKCGVWGWGFDSWSLIWGSGGFLLGEVKQRDLYPSEEQKTHRGRPFQSAYHGWSVPTKKCGYFKYISLSHLLWVSAPHAKHCTGA